MIGVIKKTKGSPEKGFTLIELLVAVAIVGIISTAISRLFLSSNEIYTVQDQIVRLQQDIRGSMYLMTRYIRLAGLNTAGNATCAGISNANGTGIHLFLDHNGNGTCSDSNPAEEVEFVYSSADKELQLGYGGASPNLLASNIDDFRLRYIVAGSTNATATPADPDDIREVIIQTCGRISGPYSGKYTNTYCFNSTVQCRNMGL